jgi:hypothetical protein
MESLLLSILVSTRVEPVPDVLVHALKDAAEQRARLILLGTRGSLRYLHGAREVNRYDPDQYMAAARAGLLYLQAQDPPVLAFSPALDAATGLPVLLEGYELAFAKRSHAGTLTRSTQQPSLMP